VSSQTLGSRAAAIRFFHRAAGLASATDQRVVHDLLEGARREAAALFVAFSPHGELRETRIEGRLVAEVVKRLFWYAGESASNVAAIGAHSLRRGFVTSADMAGATTAQIMDVTGHRDPKSPRLYIRRELLHDPVLPKLFKV